MRRTVGKLLFILLALFPVFSHAQTETPVKALLEAGQKFLQNGELDKAVAEFDKVVKADPKSVEGFYFRGTVKFMQRDAQGAIFDYGKVIELAPSAPGIDVVYNNRGVLFYMQGKDKEALADFEKAISINPNNHSPYVGRGNILADARQNEKAFADYDKAIKLNPKATEAYNGRGDIRFQKGEMDLALEDMNKVIELDANAAPSYIRRGTIHGLKGRWAAATADLRAGFGLEAQNPGVFQGVIQLALLDLDKYIAAKPSDAKALAVRGLARQMQGKTTEADADFKKSFALDAKLKTELDKFIREANPLRK